MNKLLLLLTLTLGLSADIGVEFFGTSYHFNREIDYNEEQKYFGVVWRPDDTNFEVGASTFENSYNERANALYVGYLQPLYKEEVELGIFADVGYYLQGYEDKPIMFYGGIYGEYKNVVLKIAGTDKLIAVTVGYEFDTGF